MSEGRTLQTVIQIDGVMNPSMRRAVSDVNRQLSTIDKNALAAAASIGGKISDAAKTAAKAIAGIGVATATAAAGLFVKGGNDYIRTMNNIAAQTGVTGKELQEFGQIAQDIYKSGKGESFQDIAAALVNIKQAGGLAGDELKEAANAAVLLKDTFGMEYEETTRAATALMKNFGIGAEEAYSLIAYGAQNGANKNGDLLDTLNEYSVHFKAMGLSSEQFMQALISGAEAGSFSIDKIGDAIKEFTIRSKDGSDSSAEAFKMLGLNADNMTKQFAAGGDVAEAAFFQVVEALNNMQDPVAKNAAGVALFGTMFEDLEAGVLKTYSSMKGASLDAAEAMREIERVKYKDAGYAITQIGRTIQTALIPAAEQAGLAVFETMPAIQASIEAATPYVAQLGMVFANALPEIIDFAGEAVAAVASFGLTVADNWGIIEPILLTAGGLFAGFKLAQFAKQTYDMGKAVSLLTVAYGKLYIAKAKDIAQTAQIYALYVKDAAVKALATARSVASAAAMGVQAVATLAWQGVAAAATVATTALGSALAFLTSPIGLAVAAIAGLVAAGVWMYKNWDTVKAKAGELGAYLSDVWFGIKYAVLDSWNAIKVKTGEVGAYLSDVWFNIKYSVMTYVGQLGDFVSNVWTSITSGAASVADSVKAKFTGAFQAIPGILKAPINTAISLINKAIGGINGIGFTIPDWVPGIGGQSFKVDIPNIPMLATGGFTQGPSIAGEAGTEAVISFNPAYRKENIGYLQKAASLLGLTRAEHEPSLNDYTAGLDGLGEGQLLTSQSVTTYNLGGVTFAPTVTVAGGTEKRENIIEQLKNYQGDLLDMIEELLATREAASYGTNGAF